MELIYLGHSSFKMKFKNGMVLVTDPYSPEAVGLPFAKQKADIVTVSHDHKDHNFIEAVPKPVKREDVFLISEEGEYEVGGIEVTTIKTFHDKKEGKERGENLIMLIRQNGITICHLGDLGCKLSEKQIERIGPVDILLVPVGGEYTIGDKEAVDIVSNMSPSVVVPMHYKVKGMKSMFDSLKEVGEFVNSSSLEVMLEGESKMKINVNNLPENTKIAVLKSSN